MAANDVADTEARQRFPATISKDFLSVRALRWQRQESTEGFSRLLPQWTDSLLPAFSSQADMARTAELQVHRAHVENFLHARTGVEEKEEQRMIPPADGCVELYRIHHGSDFILLKVLDGRDFASLRRDGKKPLGDLNTLWMLGGGESSERANSSQSAISRRDAAPTIRFQFVEKRDYVVWFELIEVESDDVASMPCGEKSKQEDKRVAVAAHGVGAETSSEREGLGEEAPDRTGQLRWLGPFHSSPFPRDWRKRNFEQ